MYYLQIPLLDLNGKPQGRLARLVDGGKDSKVPRIGEMLFIAPEMGVKVTSVTYDGLNLQSIHVISEPISSEHKNYFLQINNSQKKNLWAWTK